MSFYPTGGSCNRGVRKINMDPSGTLSTNRQAAPHASAAVWSHAALRNIALLLKAHRLPLFLTGIYLAAAFALPLAGLHAPPAGILGPMVVVFAVAFLMLLPISHLSTGMSLRLANMLLGAVIMTGIEVAALGFKANIPLLHPWSWDSELVALDRLFHFGSDPWRLFMPAAGQTALLKALDLAYASWFPLLLASWFLIGAAGRHDHLKNRYVIAFLLVWAIGGNMLATLVSSAGPAFLDKLGLPTASHAELIAHLTRADALAGLTAPLLQTTLWQQYEAGMNIFGGISAFPSMHNALAALMALAAWQAHRGLGILLTIFTLLIYAGSILLAWHYAVDGIAGIAIALFCWHLAGRIACHLDQQPETRRYRALLRATANR